MWQQQLSNVRVLRWVTMINSSCCADGRVTTHALGELQARGTLFVRPQEDTYNGMVIGESTRDADMEVCSCVAAARTLVEKCASLISRSWLSRSLSIRSCATWRCDQCSWLLHSYLGDTHAGQPRSGEEAQQRPHDGS